MARRVTHGAGRKTGSARGSSAKLVERELGGRLTPALRAVLDVTPGTQEPAPLGVQHDDEGLRILVQLEAEVGPPGGGRIPGVEIQSLQDAAKPHAPGVEEPGAVAGLEDERHVRGLFHAPILPQGNDKSASARLRLDDGMRATEICLSGGPGGTMFPLVVTGLTVHIGPESCFRPTRRSRRLDTLSRAWASSRLVSAGSMTMSK